jgi:hypothetical protein
MSGMGLCRGQAELLSPKRRGLSSRCHVLGHAVSDAMLF